MQLGGGCELAMMSDILIATPNAQFGQPEITLGIIPGGGGTQRLAGLIGKAKAMDLVLTNRWISGTEAYDWGLISRVTKEGESVVEEAVKVGDIVAGFGTVASQAGKEAVNAGECGVHAQALKELRIALDSKSPFNVRLHTDFSARASPLTRSTTRTTTLPIPLRDCGSERR